MKFDLCHDFSLWETETGRCIPKELDDEESEPKRSYSFPPLCNRTELNCNNAYYPTFRKYCPFPMHDFYRYQLLSGYLK